MSTSTKYELLYFPFPGRAEQIRLLFACARVPFTDTQVTDWPGLKPKAPFGQVPLLREQTEDGEFIIPQSVAILRHLARTFGMYGTTERQRTMCDYIADFIAEWRYSWAPVALPHVFNTVEATIVQYWKDAPATLTRLERLLGQSTAPAAGWFVCESPTFADVMAFDILTQHLNVRSDSLAEHAGLRGFVERFGALPGVSEYVKNRAR